MSTEYVTLRAELKAWEKEFQSKHGRKATPDDIKLVDGLVQKYKRFKALSKSEGKQPIASVKSGVAEARPLTSIIKHSQATESDRDPLPPAAKPNPFSPVKKSTTSQPASPPSNLEVSQFQPFPNLFSTPVKQNAAKSAVSPPTSPNPFIVRTLQSQPDSPFTAARKRIRGEELSEQPPPDKKRKFMNRSQSVNLSGPFAGTSTGSYTESSLLDRLSTPTEVLEESPVKPSTLNGSVYKPIFDDVPLRSTTGRSLTTRTVSLPATTLFGKRLDAQGRTASQPLPAGSTSSGIPLVADRSRRPSSSGDEDHEMEDATSNPKTARRALLPPTPTKTEGNSRRKGAIKGKKGKGRDRLEVPDEAEEATSEHSELSVIEVGWKIMGPLRARPLGARGNDDMEEGSGDDDDDENFQLPFTGRIWNSRNAPDSGSLEPEIVEIDLPEHMKEMLELSSPAKQGPDQDAVVQDVITGKDRSKQAPILQPCDFEDVDDVEMPEEWESDPPGWYEAEL